MIRRPPRSTPFPTRRSSDLLEHIAGGACAQRREDGILRAPGRDHQDAHGRSEEHTSELQSPCNLVCRLLLEKKKKTEHDPVIGSILPGHHASAYHYSPDHSC